MTQPAQRSLECPRLHIYESLRKNTLDSSSLAYVIYIATTSWPITSPRASRGNKCQVRHDRADARTVCKTIWLVDSNEISRIWLQRLWWECSTSDLPDSSGTK
ncbi:unnamed protein product [Ectocarpus fasciculatus]